MNEFLLLLWLHVRLLTLTIKLSFSHLKNFLVFSLPIVSLILPGQRLWDDYLLGDQQLNC